MGLIRLILALSVVISHSSPILGFRLLGGEISVKAFYIISGFYMSIILNEKYIKENKSYKLFITNRFLRIFPTYWIVLFLTIGFSFFCYYHENEILSSYGNYVNNYSKFDVLSLMFLFLTNIFIFFQDLIMFLKLDINGNLVFTTNFQTSDPQLFRFLFIPQAWTVALELTFYLIAPFVVRKNWKIIFSLIFLFLGLKILLSKYGLNHDPWTYRFFPTELVFFLFGNISYLLLKIIRKLDFNLYFHNLICSVFISLILFYDFISIPCKEILFYICFFIMLPFMFIKTQKSKLDLFIGNLSYPVYISHIFIFLLLFYLKIDVINGFILSVSTILFALVINHLIINKIENFRQKRLLVK